ncbi:ankyrin repeat-containing protein [Acrasis kona]|uniref:Ankyrin repeat-containing protein n=1 Tax=Acrasis kona TaxID=1008807 RepID=A0AAW2ZEG8_9EUKA
MFWLLALPAAYAGSYAIKKLYDVFGRSKLHIACENGDIESVKQLLQSGASVNEIDKDGMTALHFASIIGDVRIVILLLENSADIKAANKQGSTALMLAAKFNHEVVQWILRSHLTNLKHLTKEKSLECLIELLKQKNQNKLQEINQLKASQSHNVLNTAVDHLTLIQVKSETTQRSKHLLKSLQKDLHQNHEKCTKLTKTPKIENIHQLKQIINNRDELIQVSNNTLKKLEQHLNTTKEEMDQLLHLQNLISNRLKKNEEFVNDFHSLKQSVTEYEYNQGEIKDLIASYENLMQRIKNCTLKSNYLVPELKKQLTVIGDEIKNACRREEEEREEQDDDAFCVICMEVTKSHICVPCGHLCLCENCKDCEYVTSSGLCPVCRTEMTSCIKIF